MKLVVIDDYGEISRNAARAVARQLLLKPASVLALCTGNTPKGLYRELVRLHREGILDFSQVTSFNLDEYLGLPQDSPQSFVTYMRRHLWNYLNLPSENRHIPRSLPEGPQEECRRYETLIQRTGGLDLAILGIGSNGHIGFNEPGTPWESETHVARLSPSTREEEAPAFGGVENVPTHAITMGIKTIMRARKILLIASGEEKAEILARALTGPIVRETPASILQLHPDLTVIVDHAAAKGL